MAMFKSNDPYDNVDALDADDPQPGRGPSVLGPGLVFKGELSAREDLLIQGRIEGSIHHSQQNLTIAKGGHVKANIQAKRIIVEGTLEGDLAGTEAVLVRASGVVRGNIVSPRVTLEDGANFKGRIDMEPKNQPAEPKAKAAPEAKPAPEAKGKGAGRGVSRHGASVLDN